MNGVDVAITVLMLLFLLCCYMAWERDRAVRKYNQERDDFYASKRMAQRINRDYPGPAADELERDIRKAA